MRSKKEDLPIAIEVPGAKMRALAGQGGMTVSHYVFDAATDFRPVFADLPNGKCAVPHWGYVIKGKAELEYEDGTVETYEAGQVYYQPPGHTGHVEAGTEIVEFSPQEGYAALLDYFKSKVDG